jgi:hypothetical protein
MATTLQAPIALGDIVAILPRQKNLRPKVLKTAIVVYSGPVYIRLEDGSVYSSLGLVSIQGNQDTYIERVPD